MSQKRSSYVKRLFRDFAHHPGLLILASLGTIAQVALTVWLPILIGHAIDLVINPQGMTVLWPVLIQMVLVIVANTLIQWINPLVYNQLVIGAVGWESLHRCIEEYDLEAREAAQVALKQIEIEEENLWQSYRKDRRQLEEEFAQDKVS